MSITPVETACPTLTVGAITLRPLGEHDRIPLRRILADARLSADYIDLPEPTAGFPPEYADQLVDSDTWTMRGYGPWAIVHDDELAGYTILQDLVWLPALQPAVEIDVYIDPAHWGIGNQVMRIVYGWSTSKDLPRILGLVNATNTRSLDMCARLGLKRVGQYPYTSPYSGRSTTFIAWSR